MLLSAFLQSLFQLILLFLLLNLVHPLLFGLHWLYLPFNRIVFCMSGLNNWLVLISYPSFLWLQLLFLFFLFFIHLRKFLLLLLNYVLLLKDYVFNGLSFVVNLLLVWLRLINLFADFLVLFPAFHSFFIQIVQFVRCVI